MSNSDYSFITDRLAIGNVASRATPGFCAVVSILATDRPGTLACEVTGAPKIPRGFRIPTNGFETVTEWLDVVAMHNDEHRARKEPERVPWLDIDLADGESHALGQPRDRQGNKVSSRSLEDFLDNATNFIATYIRRGCVLVHCGAGKSRSVAVVIAYLCRYAGMRYDEAAAFVAERRPGACPAPCFAESIKRWLRLDELATKGPRKVLLRRLTAYTQEIGGYDAEDAPSTDAPSVNDQYTNEAIAQGR